jgi:hypothetical protein
MSQNFSLFNTFFRGLQCPEREKVGNAIEHIRQTASERLHAALLSTVSETLSRADGVKSRVASSVGPPKEILRHVDEALKATILHNSTRLLQKLAH